MNFDNNGMPFSIKTKDQKQFVVLVDGGRGKCPSFGVNCDGTFINNLGVDSNGKGLYKRAKNVAHSSRLTGDVLAGVIPSDEISRYLERVEIVNGPDFSVHNMIADKHGNVWVVEPGRGVLYSPADESPLFVMTNFSLIDWKSSGRLKGDGIDRYETAQKLLDQTKNIDVPAAFEILEAVKQSGGEWQTAFSMVYSGNENTVYYCYNGDYKDIKQFTFAV